MRTGRVHLKLVLIVLFAAIATAAVWSPVLAKPHITPSLLGYQGRSRYFNRDIKTAESGAPGRNWIHRMPTIDARMEKLDYFGQYLAALEMMELEREASFAGGEISEHSMARFELYLGSLKIPDR